MNECVKMSGHIATVTRTSIHMTSSECVKLSR